MEAMVILGHKESKPKEYHFGLAEKVSLDSTIAQIMEDPIWSGPAVAASRKILPKQHAIVVGQEDLLHAVLKRSQPETFIYLHYDETTATFKLFLH